MKSITRDNIKMTGSPAIGSCYCCLKQTSSYRMVGIIFNFYCDHCFLVNNLHELEYQWSAVVKLNGGQEVSIWWTCWPSIKSIVKEIISVSSDLPKRKIENNFIC